MKILFIGPYRQSDGWGLAARDYLCCLKTIEEHVVSAVPIYMSDNIDNNINSTILEAENTYCDRYDIVIQNVLPNFFEKYDGYNIGIYYSETKNLNYSVFIENINLLDELWVSSESEKETLAASGVTTKITVIPIPLNTDLLKTYSDVEPLDVPNIVEYFNFYILAEYTERKNTHAAVIAFNREFTNDEKVNLILKTSINGADPQQAQQHLTQEVADLKTRLRLFNRIDLYNNEILISQPLELKQVMSLHQTGDCLLVPSRGEAYCKPALEALCFGNTVICTEGIHTCSILKEYCTTVESIETPIVIKAPPAPHIYTGWETWNEISILDLQKKMRAAYENTILNKPLHPEQWVEDNFSYNAIANKIRERLCQLFVT